MDPLSNIPKLFIESLCQKNGQSSEEHTVIAGCLDRDIKTAYTSQGCFINELIQNADDQALEHSTEVNFLLVGNELIVYHTGKPFDKGDVSGISSYGNTENNRKSDDVDKSGYKDIGFKSVFRMAHRVDIISEKWQFHFSQFSPKWNGNTRIPWQIAPIWTEIHELTEIARTCALDKTRTVFVFALRDVEQVKQQLIAFTTHPEHIIFLKNIRVVKITIDRGNYQIKNENSHIMINDQVHSSWHRYDYECVIPVPLQIFLNNLGPQECPKRLKGSTSFKLSFCYSENYSPKVNLFSVLPTIIQAEFPFLVNAPFLLNPSREALVENDWNIFLVQEIARRNFELIKNALSQKFYKWFRFLAMPAMYGVQQKIAEAFSLQMRYLLQFEIFLPGEFGVTPINLYQSEIDTTGLYRILHHTGVVSEEGPKSLIHADIDQQEVIRRFPKVKQIQYKDIITSLPKLLVEKSQSLTEEANIQIVRVLFHLYKNQFLTKEVLESLRVMFLLTKQEPAERYQAFSLFLPDCYKPQFSFESHFPNASNVFVSEKYLTDGEEKLWASFFLAIGVTQEAKFFFNEKIEVEEIKKIGGFRLTEYLAHLWESSKSVRVKSHPGFVSGDLLHKFVWFPCVQGLPLSESYRAHFWNVLVNNSLKICKEYANVALDFFRGTKNHKPPQTYLQFVFNTYPLITDQNNELRCAKELYAPSMTVKIGRPLDKTAKLPVMLSKEMERILGFQTNLTIIDCHLYLQNLCEGPFDDSFYSFVMTHLLTCLREPKNRLEILSKSWKFYTVQGNWQPLQLLKYWDVPFSTPPQDDTHWLEPISSFTKEEMEELCRFFEINQEITYTDTTELEKSVPNDSLKNYLFEKIFDIAFQWKELDGKRTVHECYHKIVLKLGKLHYYLLPEENFFDGQIFQIENDFYFASGWKDNKDLLAKALGNYFGFTEKEIGVLRKSLTKYPRRYPKEIAKKFETFQHEFKELLELELQGAIKNTLESPPLSPRGALNPTPFNLEQEVEATVLTPQKAVLNNSTPQNLLPSPEPTVSPNQLSSPFSIQKKSYSPGALSTGSTRKPQKSNNTPNKEPSDSDTLEKKGTGMWAERHVVWNIQEKYKNKQYVATLLSGGVTKFTKDNKEVTLLWNNDPVNRPPGEENNELWDSGKPFDIHMTKKIDDLVTEKMIEVKGTKRNQIHFFLGSSEWQAYLNAHPKKYHIYVVTGANSPTACTTRYKNLIETMTEGIFPFISKTEFSGPTVIPQPK